MRTILIGSPAEYTADDFQRLMMASGKCATHYAQTPDALYHKIKTVKPDLVMLDGIAARSVTHYKLGQLVRKYKKVKFGVFTHEEIPVRHAARFVHFGAVGVIGFRYHSIDTIKMAAGRLTIGKDAISKQVKAAYDEYEDVLGESKELTQLEQEIFGYVVKHWETQTIANHLGISIETVRNHIKHIHKKMGTSDRAEWVAFAYDIGEAPTSRSAWADIRSIE